MSDSLRFGPDREKGRGRANPVPPSVAEREKYRDWFLHSAREADHVRILMDTVPDGEIFLKDRLSRYISVSKRVLSMWGLRESLQIVFLSDHHLYPPAMADHFLSKEREILASLTPQESQSEFRYLPGRGIEWVLTSRFPVFDGAGKILGVGGVTSPFFRIPESEAYAASPDSDDRLCRALEFIRNRATGNPSQEEIASSANVSTRQLARLFHRTFGTTPGKFLSLAKLDLACARLTESKDLIIDIALALGFSDQSSFTAHFKRLTGITPRRFRLRWGNENSTL